jgi:hypothetical protein
MTGSAVNSGQTESIRDFVVRTVNSILGPAGENGFSPDYPLMEMGLDSEGLLDLTEQLQRHYQIPLKPGFFFQYNTAERIIAYLQEHASSGREAADPPIQGDRPPLPGDQKDGSSNGDAKFSRTAIAITGISCRLPGGIRNKEQLWELLIGNQAATRKLPPGRWNWPSNIDPDGEHQGIDIGGFLDDIAGFDPLFFRISPKEAELIDPQQRLMLELSWECLEDAGYPARAASGSKTGVFIGASGSDYNKLLDQELEKIGPHYSAGTSLAAIPNRISYFYDFHGPSMQIDTACSSSLVAVHQALESLKKRECQQALVGGVNIICHPAASISYYKAGMLSRDGKCRTFDRDANGYARAEGAVMLLLKPLPQAVADQDTIYAVIRGSAINHGGQAGALRRRIPPDRRIC